MEPRPFLLDACFAAVLAASGPALLAACCAALVVACPARSHAISPAAPAEVSPTSGTEAAATPTGAAPAPRSTDDIPVADDVVLTELLADAIELRRREDFDRMLDARDPGELVEHATLLEQDLVSGRIDVNTLFIVGDELFSYPFRPENGWGGKGRRADDIDYTPAPRRIQEGESGGPDSFACSSCHSKGGPDGAGTQTQNAFLRGDGRSTRSADERNPPHLLGVGAVELLAKEMSADLEEQVRAVRRQARKENARVERPLTTKGVSFGTIAAEAGGDLDRSGVRGVDTDLVVRPFGWKGHQASLRGMVEESLHLHQGLISRRVLFAIKDGTIDAAAYGGGNWDDPDGDGVSLEIDSGMLTTVVGYLAQLEVPVVRPPRDPGLVDLFAAGRGGFDAIGCASCHRPVLELKNTKLDATAGSEVKREPFWIDVVADGEAPKAEPKYAAAGTPHLVHLFSDLKRHDMGEGLASPTPQVVRTDSGTRQIAAREFLTRPLWGLAETAPYLHDGRAPGVHEAIVLHGGEAAASRDAYLAMDERGRSALRVFLMSLSRQPKLFVP